MAGIGCYLTTALFARDTTAIMGGTLPIGASFVCSLTISPTCWVVDRPEGTLMPAYLFCVVSRRPRRLFGLIVTLLLLVALFALSWLAPLDQLAGCRGTPAKPPDARRWLSAPTAMAATCSRLIYGARPARWGWWR